jgi:hypothetical protein
MAAIEPLIILRLCAMGNCLNKDDEFLQYYNINTRKDLLVYGSQLQDKVYDELRKLNKKRQERLTDVYRKPHRPDCPCQKTIFYSRSQNGKVYTCDC